MTTVSRGLPERPHLDVPKREARELLAPWRNGDRDALDRIRRRHPKFADADDAPVAAGPFRLSDAQYVIAREYGLAHWTELKQRIAATALPRRWRPRSAPTIAMPPFGSSRRTRRCCNAADERQLGAADEPRGESRPPRDHQSDGGARCARLSARARSRGAAGTNRERALAPRARRELEPGIVMGACETLDADGMRFIAKS